MPVESGRKIAVGIGRETTRGTAVAPSYWAKHLELDFIQKVEKAYNESSLNVLDKYNAADVMKDWAEGKLGGKITDRSFGLLLAAAAGQPLTSVQRGTSGVYDHTAAQSQSNNSLSLTLALKDLNRDERYALAMLRSLEISAEVGQWAKFAADFLSKKPTAAAGNSVAYVAENEFKAKHLSVKLAANVAGLAGATPIDARMMKVSIDRGVDPYFALGSNDPKDIYAQEVEIKGDFTLLFDSVAHRDAYLNNTNQAMQISLVNSDVTIGATNPALVLTFPKVNLSDWGLDQGLSKMVEQTIGFQGLYSQTDGKSWDAVLTNQVAAY